MGPFYIKYSVQRISPSFLFFTAACIRLLGEIPESAFEKSFLLGSTVFREKSEKQKICKSLENGYEPFDSKSLTWLNFAQYPLKNLMS